MSCTAAAMLLALVLADCAPASELPQRIVLITVDTLRWDAFADSEHQPSAMPLTHHWSKEARVFERHYSVSSSTGPTHATLLTGQPPWRHGITRNGLILAESASTIPERLKAGGFETGAVVASFPLHRTFGFDQGFDVYLDDFQRDFLAMRVWQGAAVPNGEFFSLGDSIAQQAIDMLDGSGRGNQFFWFHYFDPHAPYGSTGSRWLDVHDIVRGAREGPESANDILAQAKSFYTQDVQFLDRELHRVLRRLQRDEDSFETHIFIVADHGESFGEDGVLAHGSRVSDEQIHVPLIVRSPAVQPGVDRAPTGSIDVARAILSIASKNESGATLLSDIDPTRRVFGMRRMFERPESERRTDPQRIIPSASEFYCVDGERIYRGNGSGVAVGDALPPNAEVASAIQTSFDAFEREARAQSPGDVLDEEARKALRALGYLR